MQPHDRRAGDQESFAALFEQHKNLVYRTAYLMLGSAEEAEDCLQDVFLSVHRALDGYDPHRGALTTWLYRITVNHCLNRQRRYRPATLPLDALPPAGLTRPPEEHVAGQEAIREALAALGEQHRAIVVLRYYADLPYADIAQVLGIPVGTVKSRLARALEALHARLAEPETHETEVAR